MTDGDSYTVRAAESTDVDGFLSLHGTVFGTWPRDVAEAVFEWKYADQPAVDRMPVVVVEHEGQIVGARGYFAMRVVAGSTRLLGLQSTDLMVHPDHRERGLFTRMTEFGLERFGGPETLFFSFPGPEPRRGYLKRGWTEVPNPEYVQFFDVGRQRVGWPPNPRALAKRLYQPLYDGYVAARTLGQRHTHDVTVADELPAETLAELADSREPDGIHAERSAAFYEWRLSHPLYETTTYLARRDGRVEAAVVVDELDGRGFLREILPAAGRRRALSALLARLRADRPAAESLTAWPPRAHRSTLRRAGYLSSDRTPYRSGDHDIVVKAPADGTVGGLSVADPTNWALQLAERDY
ncbi:GNAT family N-acetyltransferase [Haloarcula laminariae]|uniref:GNAT family N-acetyltransferase n=1 Tax=Haloarcula laminariae TaxID=2961577 RepID=UPI0021C5DBC0|nr:GNAT family N-acetyltransferase [Halomicroarcula laminariae]